MSNLWLNIRFGSYHLQCVYLHCWRGEIQMRRSPIRFSFNPYQAGRRVNEPKEWRWFQVHEIRWPW